MEKRAPKQESFNSRNYFNSRVQSYKLADHLAHSSVCTV